MAAEVRVYRRGGGLVGQGALAECAYSEHHADQLVLRRRRAASSGRGEVFLHDLDGTLHEEEDADADLALRTVARGAAPG